MRCRRFPVIAAITLAVLYVVLQLVLQLWLEVSEGIEIGLHRYVNDTLSLEGVEDFVLVWWTPFTGNHGSFLECDGLRCFITQDRRFQRHPNFQMFLFYGSNMDALDMPIPRQEQDQWALLHEESPKNVPLLSHNMALSLFNYTATFSRYSDVPLTLQYLRNINSLTDLSFYVPLKKKNELLKQLAPVLYVQSDCDTPLDRDIYVKQLMKHINIDSYGACLQNKPLPLSLSDPMESMESDDFFHFVARYKFTISFENAICEDYITEKLWRPLLVGSVPVYMGSPSVQDWLPNNKSAILVSDYPTPEMLANFLSYLNDNDEEYLKFFSHKEGIISNKYLLSEMDKRPWGPPDESQYHYVDHFECEMCQKIHSKFQKKGRMKMASEKEYSCLTPVSSLTNQVDPGNPWVHQWFHSKCEASVLHDAVHQKFSFTSKEGFLDEVTFRFKHGLC